MKAYLFADERYPDYYITLDSEYCNAEIEMTEDEIARAKQIIKDYNTLQTWLHENCTKYQRKLTSGSSASSTSSTTSTACTASASTSLEL